ncbi:MAG: phosphopantetheine adenylyltransferase [Acidobacteriota bacterium]
MRYVAPAALILVAIIHLLPLAGVLGSDRLEALYGITVDEPNLLLLMRHRAVLFGILGLLLVAAAFVRELRSSAFAAGFASVVSFLVLAGSKDINAQVARVATADWIALVLLVIGLALHVSERRRS